MNSVALFCMVFIVICASKPGESAPGFFPLENKMIRTGSRHEESKSIDGDGIGTRSVEEYKSGGGNGGGLF